MTAKPKEPKPEPATTSGTAEVEQRTEQLPKVPTMTVIPTEGVSVTIQPDTAAQEPAKTGPKETDDAEKS